MKNVLVIAYHYPPLGGGGVFRTLKFTRYLPQCGFKPLVLTARNPMYPTRDQTLLREIPKEAKVFRTFSLEHTLFLKPFYALKLNPKWIFVPDINIGWLPFAVRRGENIIKKERAALIYATAPIDTSLLIGYFLKKKTGKQLVIDFRDPWTQNVFTKYPTKLHRMIEQKMEETILKYADFIITSTEPMRLKLTEKYPFIEGKCDTITNGFDSEDFKGLRANHQRGKLTITYTGYLYGLRSGKHFLMALKELIHERKELENRIQVVFAGPRSKETEGLVKRLGLQNIVKLLGYVSHRDSLTLLLDADILLLIMAAEESSAEKTGALMIPGKVFEYLGARKRILALVPNGATADLIRSTKAGTVVPPNDTASIRQALFEIYQRWERGGLKMTESNVSEYDRKILTEKLASIFQSLLSRDAMDKHLTIPSSNT